jgi:hypothetical protein
MNSRWWARWFRDFFADLERRGLLDLSPIPVVTPNSDEELVLAWWAFEYLERRLWLGARAALWYTSEISGRWTYYALLDIEGDLGAIYGPDPLDVLLRLRMAIELLAPPWWWEEKGASWGEWIA